MEMETSSLPPEAPRPTVEGDVLVSQVLEISGGISLQTTEGPEEKDLWSMEEGDDSVFYSDEDQAHQDRINISCGANECKRLVNSVTADDDEDDPGEESIIDEEISELEKDVTQRVILTGQEEEELQTLKEKTMDQSDAADPEEQSNPTAEKSLSISTEQNIPAGKASLPVEKEEETPSINPSDVTNEERYMRLNGEQDCPAELQAPGGRQLQVEQEQDHNLQPLGFHRDHSPSYSTLPLPKKNRDLEQSFNHLSSSKYSTVSYRKIRRGNTRQKIRVHAHEFVRWFSCRFKMLDMICNKCGTQFVYLLLHSKCDVTLRVTQDDNYFYLL